MKKFQSLALTVLCTVGASQLSFASDSGGDTDIVARNGDSTVTVEDLGFYLRDRVPQERRKDFLKKPDAVAQLTENLLVIRALAEEAERSGVVDQELVDWQVALHRERQMMDQYMSSLVRAQTENINWEATARDVYTAESESFQQPERVRASHILIKADERTDEEARALAKDVMEQLESGKDFKLLAAKYSEDPSAATNLGALGAFSRGKMVPEFDKAVFAMREPGALTGPVKTQFGYHIIKLEEHFPASQQSFEEVKDQIIAKLKKEIPAGIRQNKLMEIRSSEDIQVNEEKMQEVLEQLRKEVES